MAYNIKLDGTTKSIFTVGLSPKATLDFSSYTTDHLLKFPDSDGSAGCVLVTDGAGNLVWQGSVSHPLVTDGFYCIESTGVSQAYAYLNTYGANINTVSEGTGFAGTTTMAVVNSYAYTGNTATPGTYMAGQSMFKARGTVASPAAVQSGDNLGVIAFSGHNGVGFAGGALVGAQALSNWSSTDTYSHVYISTRPSGSTTYAPVISFRNDGTNGVLRLHSTNGTKFWMGGTVSFTSDSPGTTTYATVNKATSSAASTDLTRRSEFLGGTSGQVLTSDGSGTNFPTWTTVTSSGGTVTSVGMTVPSFLSVSGSPITGSGTLAVTLSGTALPLANGGTGQTTANAALNALLPTQTSNSGKYLTTNGTNTSWATVAASPGGSSGQVQYNNSSAFAGASNVKIDATGNLVLADTTSLTTPASGLEMSSTALATRSMLVAQDASGSQVTQMPMFIRRRLAMWQPNGDGLTSTNVWGMQAPTTVGTATARTNTAGTYYSTISRLGYVSAATTNSAAEFLTSGGPYIVRGNGAGQGGYFCLIRFAFTYPTSNNTAARVFLGVCSSFANYVTADPSTDSLNDFFGIAADSGDTNLSFMCCNASSVTVTKTTLGASFPKAAQATPDLMELTVFCAPNSSTMSITLTNLNTGATSTTTTGTNIPANTRLLRFGVGRYTAGTATAVAIDVCGMYIETQY